MHIYQYSTTRQISSKYIDWHYMAQRVSAMQDLKENTNPKWHWTTFNIQNDNWEIRPAQDLKKATLLFQTLWKLQTHFFCQKTLSCKHLRGVSHRLGLRDLSRGLSIVGEPVSFTRRSLLTFCSPSSVAAEPEARSCSTSSCRPRSWASNWPRSLHRVHKITNMLSAGVRVGGGITSQAGKEKKPGSRNMAEV